MHNVDWIAKGRSHQSMHNIKQPYSNNEGSGMLPVAVRARAFVVCVDYDEVMTNVGGKDGACAAAIHDK
jgi:hypothetical protein